MGKFCKLFEDDKGEQLLIILTQSEEEEHKANVTLHFEMEGASVKIGIIGGDWDACEKYLESYSKETALQLLKDPTAWIEDLIK